MYKLPNGVRIPSVKALKDAISDGNQEFAILLSGGLVSRKTITRKGNIFRVENHIDGAIQTLSADQFSKSTYSNIGEAMEKGAFMVYVPNPRNAEIVGVIPAISKSNQK